MERFRFFDVPLVAGLVSSPAWATPLENVNALLTTLTLTSGLVLGLVRAWVEIRRLLRNKDDDDAGNP